MSGGGHNKVINSYYCWIPMMGTLSLTCGSISLIILWNTVRERRTVISEMQDSHTVVKHSQIYNWELHLISRDLAVNVEIQLRNVWSKGYVCLGKIVGTRSLYFTEI